MLNRLGLVVIVVGILLFIQVVLGITCNTYTCKYRDNSSAVVKVIATKIVNNKLVLWHGSGTFIDNQYILTAHHIALDNKQVLVQIKNTLCTAYPIYRGYGIDVDVLYSPDCYSTKTLSLNKDKARIGEEVYNISSPSIFHNILLKGYVSGYISFDNIHTTLIASITTVPGSSGSALLNTKDEIVGIIVEKLTETTAFGFVIPTYNFYEDVITAIKIHKESMYEK